MAAVGVQMTQARMMAGAFAGALAASDDDDAEAGKGCDGTDTAAEGEPRFRFRTLFISDLHLGTRGCSATELLEFLKHVECEKLYVVGDLIDVWALRRSRHWPQEHNDIVQKLLRRARKGVPLIYIPGNHDEFCLDYLGEYGNVRVAENDIHETADGRRLMVMHGHEFDCVTMNSRWLAVLGDIGYEFLLRLNAPVNVLRKVFGFGPWSLSAFVKAKVKGAVNFIGDFEKAVAHYAELHKVDGIVCGHIHTPAIREMNGVQYFNTGDWVESCTALGERADGTLELVRWREVAAAMAAGAAAGAAGAAAGPLAAIAMDVTA